jgi:lipopolysaccharide transport system ATP-binding protein
MSDKDIAIRVDLVSKRYRIGIQEKTHDSLGGAILDLISSPIKNYFKYRSLYDFRDVEKPENDEEYANIQGIIWALRDVSFEIRQGEVVGIIGSNGAGKSTLLKILSRITPPSMGTVRIRGRLSSLLEVGTGFHQELTGRENVYLNGTILGMTKKEVDRKFDEIVDFSGVEKFLDTPVKRYSSGMRVRLAFAVAAHLEPEILVIDEVLAVGDSAFQQKCLGKMQDVGKSGRTVLFVSHNMGAVSKLCGRAIWLQNGSVRDDGTAGAIVSSYLKAGTSGQSMWVPVDQKPDKTHITMLEARLVDPNDNKPTMISRFDNPPQIEIKYEVQRADKNITILYRITDAQGHVIYTSRDTDNPDWRGRVREMGCYISVSRMPPFLKPGRYTVSVGATEGPRRLDTYENVMSFDVSTEGCNVYPNQNRMGLILPVLDWEVRQLVSENEQVEIVAHC